MSSNQPPEPGESTSSPSPQTQAKMSSTQPLPAAQQQLSEDAVKQALTSMVATNPDFLRNLMQAAMQQPTPSGDHPTGLGHAHGEEKDTNDLGEVDPAAAQVAFTLQRPNLLVAINCTLQVTNFLYSMGAISEAVRNKISPDVVGLSKDDKNMILLNAVEDKIPTDSRAFRIFIEALQSEPSLEKMATILLQSYREQKAANVILGGTPSSPAGPIHRYAAYLRAYYSTEPISQDYKWPPTPSTKYINLALIKKDTVMRASADAFTRTTLRIHGDVDQILREKSPIAMENVLKPEGSKKLRFVLVEGAPGVGKSTFAWEFCKRWDRMEALRQFSLVVLLRLRDDVIQNATSLDDFFPHIDSSLSQAVAQEVIAKEGAGVLFVMDGADELPASARGSTKSLFFKVVSGTWLPKATVLVTSRPSVTPDLERKMKPHKHIEILGFTTDQIMDYAKSVFLSDPDLLGGFLEYISSTPSIQGMVYIPLNAAIVVEVYRENIAKHRPIPTTLTQLYTEFSLALLQRYMLQKQPSVDPPDLPETIEELPKDVFENLLALAKVAFECILTQTLVFSRLPKDSRTLGFTTTSPELHSCRKLSYNFLHLALQEYLAALYFSKLIPEEQRKIYLEHSQAKHLDVVWRFVAGMTSFSGIGWEPLSARGEEGRVSPFLLQCLYETQDQALHESVLGTGECTFLGFADKSSPLDYYILGCCIAHSKCTWSVKLLDYHMHTFVLGTQHVLASIHGVRSVREGLRNLRKLMVAGGGFMHTMDDATMSVLAQDIIPFTGGLEHLDIDMHFNLMSCGITELLQSLRRIKLKHLKLFVPDLGPANLLALRQLISPSTGSIVSLTIGMLVRKMTRLTRHPERLSPMQEDLDIMLYDIILQKSSLQELKLDSDLIYNKCAITFATLLEKNTNLKAIHLRNCQFRQVGTWRLALALCRNTTLEEFRFSLLVPATRFGSKGATAFLMVLLVNRSLKRLTLTGPLEIGIEDITYLVESLKYNKSIEKLTLPDEFIQHFSQTTLDSRVSFNKGDGFLNITRKM